MKWWLVIAILWCACGLYAFGTVMAQNDWENAHQFADLHFTSRDNVGLAVGEAMLGPCGAIAMALVTNFNQHGWELWQHQ